MHIAAIGVGGTGGRIVDDFYRDDESAISDGQTWLSEQIESVQLHPVIPRHRVQLISRSSFSLVASTRPHELMTYD